MEKSLVDQDNNKSKNKNKNKKMIASQKWDEIDFTLNETYYVLINKANEAQNNSLSDKESDSREVENQSPSRIFLRGFDLTAKRLESTYY